MSGRIRSIKPEWLEDEALLRCPSDARVASVALLLLADDHGNGRGSDLYLGAQIFPGEPLAKIRVALASLTRIRYVGFYEVDGQRYFAIRNWEKHQKVDRPGKPRVPKPLAGFRDTLAKIRVTLATDPDPDPDPDLDQDPDPDPITLAPEKIALAANEEVEQRPSLTLAPPKPRKAKTPSAPVADAPGFSEATKLWFDAYRAYYGTAPQWGAVNGRKIKELLSQANIEELRELIPHFFAWARPEVIKGGHSLWKGHSSLIAKLDELRADLARPQRRAVAAVVHEREKQRDHNVAQDDQAARVAKLVREKLNGNGSNARAIGAGHASPRDVQQAAIGPRAVDVGAGTPALRRAGASASAEQRDPGAEDAEPWGGDQRDFGSEASGDGSEA